MKIFDTDNIDGLPVFVKLVPKINVRVTPNYKMDPKFITCHNTANTSRGATANAHMRLLHNSASNPTAPYISYHLVVDDKECYQMIEFDRSSWSNGDGSGINSGNRTSISIEICENSDGNYEKAEQNAVKVIRYLMDKLHIKHENVVPHKKWSNKNCPRKILNREGGWDLFHKNLLVDKPAHPSNPGTDVYTVQSGDTLWDIAKEFKTTVNKIKRDNDLKDDIIFPGQKLVVKSKEVPEELKQAGDRVEAKTDLNFYNKPSWDLKDRVGICKKGEGFTIIKKIKVGNGEQYQVKNTKGNTYYITASPKYVIVEEV